MSVYIDLYHGRESLDVDMNERGGWGTQGPVLGPFEYIHVTYGSHIRGIWANGREECWLWYVGDCVYYDGVLYGDWTAFHRLTHEFGKRLRMYQEAKARPPKREVHVRAADPDYPGYAQFEDRVPILSGA
jgi:hypothetical protein